MSLCVTKRRVEQSVAMLCNVNDNGFLPAKQEVANCCANHHSQAKPNVVCHENQHQQEAQRHLHYMEERLIDMHD